MIYSSISESDCLQYTFLDVYVNVEHSISDMCIVCIEHNFLSQFIHCSRLRIHLFIFAQVSCKISTTVSDFYICHLSALEYHYLVLLVLTRVCNVNRGVID